MKRAGGIQSLGRAPVPEWEEVARAAWPGRLPPAAIALAGRAFLPALAGSLALLLLAAWLHPAGRVRGQRGQDHPPLTPAARRASAIAPTPNRR